MTASDVVFDTWAWWEVVGASPRGIRLQRRYLRNPSVRIHTSALAVGELMAKFIARGDADRARRVVPLVASRSRVHDVRLPQCVAAATIREELRRDHPDASLADAIMVALAVELDAVLISGDSALDGHGRTRST